MAKSIIEVHTLSKRYRLGTLGAGSMKEDLEQFFSRFRRKRYHDPRGTPESNAGPKAVWALRDVSFSVSPGEVLGIIGGNGAGKSTLLKILSRITEPTRGEAILRGRVASLLEVGTGFHPDLTGRENIFLNAAILGMRQEATKRKLGDIIGFSGVEQFIDTPVKRYSSGMRVRLAFSIAAFLDADILIADEVLAVGDANFQAKCLGKMSEVAKSGRTVLFVSHDLGAVQNLCDRVIALRQGEMIADSTPADAIRHYLASVESSSSTRPSADGEAAIGPHISSTSVSQGPNTVENLLMCGQPAHFTTHIRSAVPGTHCALELFSDTGILVSRILSPHSNTEPMSSDVDITCVMDPLRISPGRYRLAGTLFVNGFRIQSIESLAVFEVKPGFINDYRVDSQRWCGFVHLPHEWHAAEPESESELVTVDR
jgi:lipopolysaccharide transport system ATP-binding protein